MPQPHYVTQQFGENIFDTRRRWRTTCPPGHRGNMFIRLYQPLAAKAEERPEPVDEEAGPELSYIAPYLGDPFNVPPNAIQSVIDRLAPQLAQCEDYQIDDSALVEALAHRAARR
jgi:hypothetical protein